MRAIDADALLENEALGIASRFAYLIRAVGLECPDGTEAEPSSHGKSFQSRIAGRRERMAIEQRGEWKYSLVCDECGHEVKYFNTFDEAVDYKRENGWKSKKENGEWVTLCPNCQQGW